MPPGHNTGGARRSRARARDGSHNVRPVAARVEWIDSRERLTDPGLTEPWDRLAANEGTPFSRSAWFRCWWDSFGSGGQLAVCALWRGEELAALLALYRRGTRLHALSNVHTPLFRPLATDRAALDSVLEEAVGACSQLEIFGLPAGGQALAALGRAAADKRLLQIREPQHVSPIVDTSGDLERYLHERRSQLRETARRRRKMLREHSAVFRCVERPLDLEGEIELGFALEGSGWKATEGTAILSDARAAAFYRSLAVAFHATDELRLSTLELDGRLVAFDFALLAGDRYWLLKTAYDESRARLGPGLALRLSVVERCFERGLEAHEFLGDDMDYKRRFSTGERTHEGFRAYDRAPAALARYAYRRHARPQLRRAYRGLRARRDASRHAS